MSDKSASPRRSLKRELEQDDVDERQTRRRLDERPSPDDQVKPEDDQRILTERMSITDADASFILGTGGRTKKKLARVSRAELSVTQNGRDDTILEMRGTSEAIDRARTYVEFVMQQRVGPVRLSQEVKERQDLVILDIPHECVGYVTGAKGQGLRSVEEEFSTLMFFTDVNKGRPSAEAPKTEKLVIFSPCQRARQGAVLKVMSAIEQKLPGHFTSNICEKISEEEDFDVDIATVNDEDYSYALGRGGGTRKKLARASGAVLEYIGRFAYIAGDKAQRERARQYLKWLCAQRVGLMKLDGIDKRDDVDQLDVPMDCVAYVTGQKGQALRRMEEQTGTFMFLDGSRGAPTERLYIFGESASGRGRARVLAEQRIDEKISGVSTTASSRTRYDPGRGGGRGGGYWNRSSMSPARRTYERYAGPPRGYERDDYGGRRGDFHDERRGMKRYRDDRREYDRYECRPSSIDRYGRRDYPPSERYGSPFAKRAAHNGRGMPSSGRREYY